MLITKLIQGNKLLLRFEKGNIGVGVIFSQLDTAQIKRCLKVQKKVNGKLIVDCSKCKKPISINDQSLRKNIEKYGSEEKLRKNYLCRKCRPKNGYHLYLKVIRNGG